MQIDDVPPVLRHRLGDPATAGLLDVLEAARKDWTSDVIGVFSDRFERRLIEETSGLRVEMAQGFSGLRQEITAGLADVRQEMTAGFADVRQEMTAGFADVRQEMASGFASLRQDGADQRFEILKWAFLFWVGQFFAVAGLMAVAIRYLRL
jgi:hypothetical protein